MLAAAAGALLVGPALNHAIVRWIGSRVVVPSLLGWVPTRSDLGPAVSRCHRCGGDLRARLPLRARPLPALPWVLRGGRCRACAAPLDRRWLAVELVTATLFAAAAVATGWSIDLLPVMALLAGLVAMCAVDLACWRIPTRFVWVTGAAVAAGLLVAGAALANPGEALVGAVVGSAAVGGFLGALHLISPRMLGLGDVRLAVVAGAVVGWLGGRAGGGVAGAAAASVGMLLVAGLAGVAAGVVLLAQRRRNAPYPFGPALAAGAVVQVLAELGR